MRSLIEPRLLEGVARTLLLSALAVLLWRAWSPPAAPREAAVSSDGLQAALEEWTTSPSPARVSVRFEHLPGADARDWLAAVRRAGAEIAWSGELQPLAVEAVASAEPQHSYVIRASAGDARELVFRDRDRELVTTGGGGASIRTSMLLGPVGVSTGEGSASAAAPVAPRVSRVAVVGPAGWETKFVIAALEERGWRVDSRVTVAPGVGVGSFSLGALDTARYSAIVIVDEAPPVWLPDVTRFLDAGGGLVVSGAAVRHRSLAALLPARPGRTLTPSDTVFADRTTLGGSTLVPGPRAVVLEARGAAPIVAGGRFGAGRVIVSGYGDTWQWRMLGDEQGLEAHRDWWSAVVGAAAYAPDTSDTAISPESAPLAALHAALGPPGAAGPQPTLSFRRFPLDAALFGLTLLALVGETVSRRRRGLA
ncbi:MAG TPA: hypothetical protein VMM17_05375 [Gemmatimonadaceae bacterium]|nr:hypothetical protein [Gemmatimonadaceae bacterium]